MTRQDTARVVEPAARESARPSPKRESPARPYAAPLQLLHNAIGNRATVRLLQAKLRVSEPGDASEQEADRVAAAVINSADPTAVTGRVAAAQVQRACRQCEDEEEEKH